MKEENIMTDSKQVESTHPDKDKIKLMLKEAVETIVTVLILVILIRSFAGEPRWIPSSSMEPTLQIGDNLVVEKISYRFSKPKRGDIMVFYPPGHELDPSLWGKFTRMIGFFSKDDAYIKRVIGLPGDKIQVVPTIGVFVNGKLLKEPYIKEIFYGVCEKGMYCGPFTVPVHNYYMMGDNRNDSRDSKYWGTLPEDRIVGRASFRFWPLNRIGILTRPEY